MTQTGKISRRDFLKFTGLALAGTAAASPLLASCAQPSASQPPTAAVVINTDPLADVPKVAAINILINDSPWFPGFEKLVNLYEEKTGNIVNLSVTPFTGMQEKTLNAVTASESEFDIVNLNEGWYATYYSGKFMAPLQEIDPDFKLDPNIIHYEYATHWNHEKNYSLSDGVLYGLPINGNIQLFYYRTDLFEQEGLKVPESWAEVEAAAKIFHKPQDMYGFATRGQKAGFAVAYDWLPFLRGHNADWVAKPGEDWTVTLNSDNGKKAVKLWADMIKNYGPENIADVGQAELIQLMAGGKMAQALMVVANFASMDDPEKSLVVDKVGYSVLPKPVDGIHATTSGIWVMGIPKNLATERQKAALTFLKWALSKEAQLEYTKFGAVPVRQDVYTSDLANEKKFRWMKAMADSTPHIIQSIRIPEGPQVIESLELHLNEIAAGLMEPEEALELMATETFDVLEKSGYNPTMG